MKLNVKQQKERSAMCAYRSMKSFGLVIVGVLISCGNPAPEQEVPIVSILQDKPQEWADALKLGFYDGLEEQGVTPGEQVLVRPRSAAGQGLTLDQVATTLARADNKAVFTLGTQASQQYFEVMQSGAMIFGAVTDPIAAGFYNGSLDAPAKNVTGTQDLWPYEAQFQLIRAILPTAKTIGTLYNSSEVNSQVSIRHAKRAATKSEFELVERVVADDRAVEAAVAGLLSAGVDAIYIPADNTAQGQAHVIISLAHERGVPVFTGISGIVENGAVATVGTNYYEVGRVNARQVAQVLQGAQASSIPVAVADRGDIYVNMKVVADLGLTVPDTILQKALEIYGEDAN